LRLLEDDFLRRGVRLEEISTNGIYLRDAADRRMGLADMSEGYRSALAMLIDIFRHMVSVFGPDIVSKGPEGTPIVTRPGVVLVDEIDAHLHPAWQREIGFWLPRHFPSVQFVVTTHSPIICQAADHGRIYHMPQPGEGEPFRLSRRDYETIIAGKPSEILLTPAFGLAHTRSPIAVRARQRHAELVAKRMSRLGLTTDEDREMGQLDLFAEAE
jgi:hypothetical protein